jgi:hypothetical protein
MSRGQLKLFSGSAHRALAAEIGEFLGVQLGQARLLRLLKCDKMQGYLFSKPVPCETFEGKFLKPSL